MIEPMRDPTEKKPEKAEDQTQHDSKSLSAARHHIGGGREGQNARRAA